MITDDAAFAMLTAAASTATKSPTSPTRCPRRRDRITDLVCEDSKAPAGVPSAPLRQRGWADLAAAVVAAITDSGTSPTTASWDVRPCYKRCEWTAM